MFCGRNEETGQAVATKLSATFIKVDVTDATQVESFFNQVFFLFDDGFCNFATKNVAKNILDQRKIWPS